MTTLDELRQLAQDQMEDVIEAFLTSVTAICIAKEGTGLDCTADDLQMLKRRTSAELERSANSFRQIDAELRRSIRAEGVRPRIITAKQSALLHLATKELGFSDARYRAFLDRFGGGCESSSALDRHGFDWIMRFYAGVGFSSTSVKEPPTRETFGRRSAMASPAQVDLIRSLWGDYTGNPSFKSDDDLNAWLEKSFHVSALRFVDKATAGKAITGLKRMVARKAEKQAG